MPDCIVNSHKRFHIIYDTSRVSRKHARINRPSGHCINQLALAALRVLGHKLRYFQARVVFDNPPQLFNTVHFVIFNTEYALRFRKQLQDNLHPFHKLLRVFHHAPVVRSQIRLTLRTVCNDIIDFVRLLWRKLDMCREPRTAHADHSGIFDFLNNFFLRQQGDIGGFLKLCFLHFPVALDDNGVHKVANRYPARLDFLHFARYGRMNR